MCLLQNILKAGIAAAILATSPTLRAEEWTGRNAAWVSQQMFDTWTKVLKEQSKISVLNEKGPSAAVLCVDWRQFQVAEGENTAGFTHWWTEDDAPSAEGDALAALGKCDAWRRTDSSGCECRVVARNMQPAFDVMQSQDRSSSVLQYIPAPFNATPKLVLQAGHTGEVTMALAAPGGVQAAYQNGDYNSSPVAPATPVPGLDIVVTQANGVVIIWDRLSGRELRRTRKVSKITSLALSADGAWILGRDEANSAHLWSATNGAEVRTFKGVGFGIALSPDGKMAVLSSEDPAARGLYEMATGRLVFRMDFDEFDEAEFSSSGDRVLTRNFSDFVTLWDVTRGRVLFRRYVPALQHALFDIKAEHTIVVSSQIRKNQKGQSEAYGGRVQVWDTRGHDLFELRRPESVRNIRLTADPDHMLVLGKDLELWSIAHSRQICTIAAPASISTSNSDYSLPDITDAVSSTNAMTLITLHSSGNLRIWDLQKCSPKHSTSDATLKDASALIVSAQGDQVLTSGGIRGVTRSWAMPSLEARRTFSRNERIPSLTNIGFTPDGHLIISSKETSFLWNLLTGKPDYYFDSVKIDGSPIYMRAVDANGQLLSTEFDQAGKSRGIERRPIGVTLNRNGTRIAAIYDNGDVTVKDAENDHLIYSIRVPEGAVLRFFEAQREILLSPDGNLLAVERGNQVEIYDNKSNLIRLLVDEAEKGEATRALAFSPSGRRLLVGYEDGRARIFDVGSGKSVGQLDLRIGKDMTAWNGDAVDAGIFLTEDLAVAKSMSGIFRDWRATGPSLIKVDHDTEQTMADAPVNKGSATYSVSIPRVLAIAASPDGRLVATGGADGTIRLWDSNTGMRRAIIANGSSAVALAFSPDGKLMASAGEDGSARLWRLEQDEAREAASLVDFTDGQWAVLDPNGRFDTNQIERLDGLGWVMADTPFRVFPPELFMRDFFKPRLVRLVLDNPGNSDAVDNIATRNRIQPGVQILNVVKGRSSSDVIITVEASAVDDRTQPNGKTHTDAYDLRLFRDGELVGQWPDTPGVSDEIGAWRQRTHLKPETGATTVTHDFVVKLPTGGHKDDVVFTAYAFNEDRVKSETASLTYPVPKDIAPREARAYVVTIGANSYDAAERRLRFAVRDAEAMGESLAKLAGYKIVPVILTSDGEDQTQWRATKANIRAVLARLAGKPTPPGALAGVQGAAQLAQATPDDLVVVTFSGHGYTTKEGAFYLLPSDSGQELRAPFAPETLAKFISSEELSEWLRPVDAGQMAMIIDACHSAASVDQPGFKPGPMGDRGLGQLAYDKAMRILAASQADDVALESERLKQGLLTYALVHDGLAVGPDGKRAADANHDGKLTLAEWLRYGEQHTPALFEDIRAGRKDAVYVGRDSVVDPAFKDKVADHAQTPSLFDFARATEADVAFQP